MTRYLKQVIVARKDLCMPSGKLAAMVAHAAMTFMLPRLRCFPEANAMSLSPVMPEFSADQWQWLTELDPGLEHVGQVSMAKIVCQVADEAELLAVEARAKEAGLGCHRVVDSGCSHNKPGTLACVAIGPEWPERLDPVTGGLKVYR